LYFLSYTSGKIETLLYRLKQYQLTSIKLVLLSLVLVVVSCSPKKNTFTRRTYHNITAHYNAYYNGDLSLNDGIKTFEKQYVDEYTSVLPVFPYPDEAAAQAITPQMDRAIKKASKVISKHSFAKYNKKRREYCKWIDDAYLMMGKAQFYKEDYITAQSTFNFVISRYKEDISKYDAMLWNARIGTLREKYDQAQSNLDNVVAKASKGGVSKEVYKEVHMVYADFFIRSENYAPAIEHLLKAIERNRKKSVKSRLCFILAQIYEREGKLKEATFYYKKVIKMNPPYDMAFHAKIFMAKSFDAESDDPKDIKKILLKMLKDEKNKDYLDEIYYALAEIAKKEENLKQTKEYLRLSVQKSISNNYQKAISSLDLADIYFEELDYTNAQAYYDSTMTFLPKDFPNYKDISDKHDVLSELVTNLMIVQREDSLQKLAKMTTPELNAFIDNIIQKIREEEERIRREEIERQQMAQNMEIERRQQSVTQTTGSWYFDDPSQLSFGYTEFTKKWGKRKLEDLWRLSDKQTTSMDFGDGEDEFGDEFGDEKIDGKESKENDNKNREFYLKDIPLTPEKMQASNKSIANALYSLGIIYKEGLNDMDKSIESFGDFEDRYPNDTNIIKVYYQLYRIYKTIGIRDKEEKYKRLITNNFPDSDYAKIIADPEYFKKLAKERNIAEQKYAETYDAYLNGNLDQVFSDAEKANKEYNNNEVLAKFEYLKALSYAKRNDTTSLKTALNKIISDYSKTEVKPLAQNMLDFLTKPEMVIDESSGEVVEGGEQKEVVEQSKYQFDPKAIHLFVAVVAINKISISNLKNQVSDHNKTYFSLEGKLTVSSLFLDQTRQLLTISNFKQLPKGYEYIKSIKNNKELYNLFQTAESEFFLMSVNNYSTFFKSKDVEEYKAFYLKNYKND
jgi:tetratricopeptide (TPR) repeat protein